MTVLLVALGPALLILIYIYFRDKYEKEPILLLVRGFAAGALILVPILIIEVQLGKLSVHFPAMLKAAWDGFIVASATEEVLKFLAVYYLFWNNSNFNEKFDGIVYSVAVSLGFAALENFFYVYQGTLGTGLLRAFTAVPAHAVFGVVMGYYLGMARFRPFRKSGYIAMAMVMPWIFHGLYDFLLLSGHRILSSLFIPLMIILVVMAFRRMKEQSDASAFRYQPQQIDQDEPLA
jgi:RsiW-degrading membrane proteinase PrsW (M82 family)